MKTELRAEIKCLKGKYEEILENISALREESRILKEEKDPLVIIVERGRDSDIIGRSDGYVVLFSNQPSEDKVGDKIYGIEYEKRTSKNTGKDYYKCFSYLNDLPINIAEDHQKQSEPEDKITTLKKLERYFEDLIQEKEKKLKDLIITTTLHKIGITDLNKILSALEIGLYNILNSLNTDYSAYVHDTYIDSSHHIEKARKLYLIKDGVCLNIYNEQRIFYNYECSLPSKEKIIYEVSHQDD